MYMYSTLNKTSTNLYEVTSGHNRAPPLPCLTVYVHTLSIRLALIDDLQTPQDAGDGRWLEVHRLKPVLCHAMLLPFLPVDVQSDQ